MSVRDSWVMAGMLDSLMDFHPKHAGKASMIKIVMKPSFSFEPGDNVTIKLPMFEGPSSANLILTGNKAASQFASGFDGAWNNGSGVLSLNATSHLDFPEIVLFVNLENNLRLPAAGISPQSNITIAVRSRRLGALSPLPLAKVTPVGGKVYHSPATRGLNLTSCEYECATALLTASLGLTNRVPGELTSMMVNFSLSHNLSSGDQVVLGLGRFYRDWFRPIRLLGGGRGLFQGAWLNADYGPVALQLSSEILLEQGHIRRAATNLVLDAELGLSGVTTKVGPGQAWVDGRSPPVVLEVFSLAAPDLVYLAGDVLDIRVRFSDPVVIQAPTGPVMRLATRKTPWGTLARYIRGNGTNTLVLQYVVELGDKSNNLGCLNTRALEMPEGGEIMLFGSQPGHAVVPANLTLPPLCGNLGRKFGVPQVIRIDGDLPSRAIRVTTEKPNGTYGAGELIDLFVHFTEPVIVRGAPGLVLNTAGRQNTSAVYTAGGRVQSFDIGVKRGQSAANGNFALSYLGSSSACIQWNDSSGIAVAMSEAIKDLAGLTAFGRPTVDAVVLGLGHRIVISFAQGCPGPLTLNTSFCGGDAEDLSVSPTTSLVFR
jgi:hypothetical protein